MNPIYEFNFHSSSPKTTRKIAIHLASIADIELRDEDQTIFIMHRSSRQAYSLKFADSEEYNETKKLLLNKWQAFVQFTESTQQFMFQDALSKTDDIRLNLSDIMHMSVTEDDGIYHLKIEFVSAKPPILVQVISEAEAFRLKNAIEKTRRELLHPLMED